MDIAELIVGSVLTSERVYGTWYRFHRVGSSYEAEPWIRVHIEAYLHHCNRIVSFFESFGLPRRGFRSSFLPTLRIQPHPRQKSHPHYSSRIHKANIAPIHSIPFPKAPIYLRAQGTNTVKVSKICQQKPKQDCSPNPQI